MKTKPSQFHSIARAVLATAVLLACPGGKAGDILRAHTTTSSTPGSGAAFGATAATTAQARANANDTLARTTQALQSIQAMQNTARNLARTGPNNLGMDPSHPGQPLPNVPNGLAIGGLVPDAGLASQGVSNPTITWQGAQAPVQSVNGAQTNVTIQQTAQQAILNWQTFNVGRDTVLNIDQSAGGANAGQWVAFNKISDPSGIPSQILGSIQALGQIYLINQNGIIFGGASQVNAHALVASSLPINTNLISLGLLNNPNEQFLFSQVANIPDGDVVVQAGAQLSSPTTADHVGGKIVLIGPNVSNAGTISTPDGQTILAAGNQVAFAAHPSTDPSLRGLDVFVGSVDQSSGVATNTGLIDAPRADVTVTGQTVNQLGFINSLTSVSLNGRIDLLADYNAVGNTSFNSVSNAEVPLFVFQSIGNVNFGPDSVTQVLPDLASAERVVGSQLALPSLVNVRGETIHLQGGATILAPGATLPIAQGAVIPLSNTGISANAPGGITSGITLNAGNWSFTNGGGTPVGQFVYTGGQIYLDAGAEINAAGSTDVNASVSENIVAAQLRGAELANSPLQRNGALRGQTVNVDILQTGVFNGQNWVGSPIGDLSGYANLVDHTVGELTTSGGSVTLSAGASVVMQPGSKIDVSGGWINYQGAMVQTTKVVSNGHIYDISQATPDLVYQGILGGFTVDYSKWGVSESFNTVLLGGPHFEDGFIQGGNGGAISITAPAMALDGNLLGNTFAGARQRTSVPLSSALSLDFQAQAPVTFFPVLPTDLDIIFQQGNSLPAADPFALDGSGLPLPLSAARQQEVDLSPDLINQDGFGTFAITSDGRITLPANVTLTAPVNGSFTAVGSNIDIEGKISVPGGNISFTVNDFSPTTLAVLLVSGTAHTPPADPTRGNFTLGSGALLSTAGLVVDDRPGTSAPETLPLVTNGGGVTVNSFSANLEAGSAINVNGGVIANEAGKISYGSGGSIAIRSGQDPTVSSILGGKLVLQSSLTGYAGSKGGSLTIQTSLIQIGGAPANSDTLVIDPSFFSSGGFNSFTLNGLGESIGGHYYDDIPAVMVAPGVNIAPVVQNWVAIPGANGIVTMLAQYPEGVRQPVNLTFNALGANDFFVNAPVVRGDFVMGAGSNIELDPQGSVTIKGSTVAVLGSITVPGGAISITGGKDSTSLFLNTTQALPTVDLGPGSVLSVAGVTMLTPDPTGHGYRTGSILGGGSINISGNIVAEAGSVLNVSGASGILDLPASYSQVGDSSNSSTNGNFHVPTRVDSNGGSVTLAGSQELFTAATLLGNAGGPSAQGGILLISSGRFYPVGTTVDQESALDVTLSLTQNESPFHYAGATAIGNAILDTGNNALAGRGYFAANDFDSHGFDSLSLRGTVQFSGPVTLVANNSVTIVANTKFGNGVVLLADPAVANSSLTITAPYVDFATLQGPLNANNSQVTNIPFTQGDGNTPIFIAPTFGAAGLVVNATQLIDIGNLSLQNIGNATFNVGNGDVRGDGTLDVQGNITITAGQIYPPTAVTFNIFAYDHGVTPGSVTIHAGAARSLPLSAGGELNIYASTIHQGGVLRAPIGGINLGWDGTGAAPVDPLSGNLITVTPTIQLNLAAGSVTSVSAVDPLTGQALVIPYGINLNGNSWIDPNGSNITTAGNAAGGQGVPFKSVNISANNVAIDSGATIDIQGGGDLYAYRFVSGNGGNTDILASTTSYAVIPGYQAGYSPFAPFTTIADAGATSNQLGGDPGYVNGSLHVGDQVYLGASYGLPAGFYTLLPARYALLPGAALVTQQSGVPAGTVLQPDGSSLVSGYFVNNLSTAHTAQPLFSRFEVDPQSVVLARAEYDSSTANNFFTHSAQANNIAIPRLPMDSGQLVLAATKTMTVNGSVDSLASAGGRGGLVDISSPADILIAGPNASTSSFNGLVLDSSSLSAFGAESLLIGGVRQSSNAGTTVTVTTNNITVDNSGAALTGPEVILAANQGLVLAPGSEITQTGITTGLDSTLLLGNSNPGSADGVLLRVSSNPAAQLIRSGVDSSAIPLMTVGAGANISGVSVTLDSTSRTDFDPAAVLTGQIVNLDSGQISLQLDNPGALQPTSGLVLSSAALQTLQASSQSLSLLSYSSIDIYGTGQVGSPSFTSLALHFSEIRGFNSTGGTVKFAANNILLDNSPVGNFRSVIVGQAGTLEFDASVIRIGVSQLNVDQYSAQLAAQPGSQVSSNQYNLNQYIDQYAQVNLNASGGLLLQQTNPSPQGQVLQGSIVTSVLNTQGNLSITTPLITGVTGANQTIIAGGALSTSVPAGNSPAAISGGLGASLILQGAGVTVDNNVTLHSGALTLHATSGNLQVGTAGNLDVSGAAETFFDLTKYTSGGNISLIADSGNVDVAAGGALSVSAQPAAGDAGTLSVSVPGGSFNLDSNAVISAGGNAKKGTFSLDSGSIPGGNLGSLASVLSACGFTESVTIRDRTDALITVDGTATAHAFNLSTDAGSIAVTGKIDASGMTGGTINLVANGNLMLQGGSRLSAAGEYYDDAGKGGAITLEAGSETNGSFAVAAKNPDGTFSGNGYLDIQTGAEIDLNVNHQLTSSDLALGKLTDNRTDLFQGTLHLRTPQTPAGDDLQINPINGTINNASAIIVEGYRIYDLTSAGGSTVDSTVEANIMNDGNTFAGIAGQPATANYTAMQNRLFSGANAGLVSSVVIQPGAEIINKTGDLTLADDWDLSTFRFGPNSAPGVLTMRAAGNLVFNGALSDGFTAGSKPALYQYILMQKNAALPANAQAWSYRLTAGADFSAANFRAVEPLDDIASDSGSLFLGQFATNVSSPGGDSADIATAITGFYQVIRTGAGDIDISTGRDVQLRNEFAAIYTVGTQADPMANFNIPRMFFDSRRTVALYPAQYSLGGGNVTINAQGNIIHLTQDNFGNLKDDSVRELPMNWLYRRGFVNASGVFGKSVLGDIASTSWWVDFSNFFEGVGALGGGNVTMKAGGDIRNVDAVIPTNARMPGIVTGTIAAAPDPSKLLELGGGDLSIQAGNNISGGVYYIERGNAVLVAGNSILTNSTRTPYATDLFLGALDYPSSTWLPTTLFLGKGSYNLEARNDLLLGPVENPFLLPAGAGNSFWYKTYFSTYDPADTIQLTSLAGNVTLRESVISPIQGDTPPVPILQEWMQYISVYSTTLDSAAFFQPWIRLNETSILPFTTAYTMSPPSLLATSFSGDINISGQLTLTPSPVGTIDLVAANSVNGLQVVGAISGFSEWGTGLVNLSDANPGSIPGVATPFAYQNLTANSTTAPKSTRDGFLSFLDNLFDETGATSGPATVLQTKQALHTAGLLHANDPDPVRIYAADGSISGLTLFSAKFSDVIAGEDITDIALYIQNNTSLDTSVVSAGRDLVAYDPVSVLRGAASNTANGDKLATTSQDALPGDIQIGGPGALEVLAGHNIDLGVGQQNSDGTALGIVSIGNQRNPYLPFGGADIVAGAGIGNASGLDASSVDFKTFIARFIEDPAVGPGYLSELAATDPGSTPLTPQTFTLLSPDEQDRIALQVFYLVLRDAGRDHNKASSPGFGNYNAGFAAVAALFPGSQWQGDISITSREIKTANGGDISIFAPGGQLTLGNYPVSQVVKTIDPVTKKPKLIVLAGNSATDMGIVTQDGGNIGIYTHANVDIGTQRIFTLRGGNEIIWSSAGNIAAGASSKTVQSAPPTRVLIDPQSGNVQTDLSGLATGGGIGVLATVAGVAPGDVDLIAPAGTIDAGDAGIRVSGNLNISATVVLNAGNIQVGGASSGTPVAASAPNIGGLTAGNNANAAGNSEANDIAKKQAAAQSAQPQDVPSVITVEVLGYGGGDGGEQSQNDDRHQEKPDARGKAAGQRQDSPLHKESSLAMNTGAGGRR